MIAMIDAAGLRVVVLQSGRVSAGDIANLGGAALLAWALFHYVQYKRASDPDERKAARRAATRAGIVFMFYTYAIATFLPASDAWTARLGLTVESYFRSFGRKLVLFSTLQDSSQATTDSVVNAVRTLGLISYIGLFGATSIAAKTPLRIYRRLFG